MLAGFLIFNISTAYADNLSNQAIPTINTSNKPSYSNAIAFGEQAGSIAGVARACGQDPSLFITRVNEALDKIAISPADKVTATQTFQQAMQKAQATETQKQIIPCTQAIQDFNNLPLLRNDYKETVLPQLNPNMTNPNKNTAPSLPPVNNSIPVQNSMNSINPANPSATQQQMVTATPSTPSNVADINANNINNSSANNVSNPAQTVPATANTNTLPVQP